MFIKRPFISALVNSVVKNAQKRNQYLCLTNLTAYEKNQTFLLGVGLDPGFQPDGLRGNGAF